MPLKKAFKNKMNYIFGGILSFIGFLPFIIESILNIPAFNSGGGEWYVYATGLIATLYFLVGFIWGDLYSANIRRKTKNWDGPLPDDISTSAWNRRLPWWMATVLVVILLIVISLIFTFTGHYPYC